MLYVYKKDGKVFSKLVKANGEIILENIETCIGKNGFTDKSHKQEGDNCTPTGEYNITMSFGHGKLPNGKETLIENLDHLHIENEGEYFWVDDPNSKYYNQLVSKDKIPFFNSSEDLFHELYKYALVMDFNSQCEKGKGSAIFVHLARPSMAPTAGCIAYKEADFLNIVNNINEEFKITIED